MRIEGQVQFVAAASTFTSKSVAAIDRWQIVRKTAVHLSAANLHVKAAQSAAANVKVFPFPSDAWWLADQGHVCL